MTRPFTAMFVCPECSDTVLHEHETGLTVTREVQGINSQDCRTQCSESWESEENKVHWTCGHCGWRLPVQNVYELICYLEGLMDSKQNHMEPG